MLWYIAICDEARATTNARYDMARMNKNYDDSNWREEYKAYTSDKKQLELLENGPKSLSQSWILGALYNKWKKMKGYKDPEPPDCSSSLKEWEESIKKWN